MDKSVLISSFGTGGSGAVTPSLLMLLLMYDRFGSCPKIVLAVSFVFFIIPGATNAR